jgi:hypothetical protein
MCKISGIGIDAKKIDVILKGQAIDDSLSRNYEGRIRDCIFLNLTSIISGKIWAENNRDKGAIV